MLLSTKAGSPPRRSVVHASFNEGGIASTEECCACFFQRRRDRLHRVSLARAATSTIFVATKLTRVCRDKTRPLSRQKYACRDKRFVATKLCLLRQKTKRIATNVLSRKIFVATNTCLSRQTYFCRDKRPVLHLSQITFVTTNICRDKTVYILKMEHLHAESVR